MSTEQNKAIGRRFYEIFNSGKLDSLREIVAPNIVDHNPLPGQAMGVEGTHLSTLGMFRAGIPDMRVDILEEVAEGDKVSLRLAARGTNSGSMMGMPPTGKAINFAATDLYQITNGKIIAAWHVEDQLGMMQQMGVIPSGS